LVEGGADEIGNDSDGIGRWRDQPHVTWVPNMRAIRKKFLFQFSQHLFWRAGILRQWLGEKMRQQARLDIREDRLFFDVLQILGQHVYHAVADFAKFSWVHEST
jgi:hypothetical protein